jgi:hypothetical protein
VRPVSFVSRTAALGIAAVLLALLAPTIADLVFDVLLYHVIILLVIIFVHIRLNIIFFHVLNVLLTRMRSWVAVSGGADTERPTLVAGYTHTVISYCSVVRAIERVVCTLHSINLIFCITKKEFDIFKDQVRAWLRSFIS